MVKLRVAVVVAALVALLAVVAGCGGGTEEGGSPTSEEGTTATETAAPADTGAAGTTEAAVGTTEAAAKECIIGWSFGPSDSPTFQELRKFAEPEAEARGCELVLGSPAGDPVKQFNEIQTWIRGGQITALVVLPLADNLEPVLKEASDAGIPVVGYASEQPFGTAAILYNTPALGEQLSQAAVAWIQENFGDDLSKFSYAMITFDQCGPACSDRTDTIRDTLKAELGIDPVQEASGVSPEEGFKIGQTFLQAHPDLNMVLGVGDAVTTGVLRAFEQADRDPATSFLGGMDGDLVALEAIAAGKMYRASSALKHSDIGKAVVDLPADILENGTAENAIIEPVLVDSPEAAEAYIAEEYGS